MKKAKLKRWLNRPVADRGPISKGIETCMYFYNSSRRRRCNFTDQHCLIQVQLQNALSEEMLRRQNCEACVQEHKEVLESTTYELQECKKFLTKECSTNNCLKQELTQFKVRELHYWCIREVMYQQGWGTFMARSVNLMLSIFPL